MPHTMASLAQPGAVDHRGIGERYQRLFLPMTGLEHLHPRKVLTGTGETNWRSLLICLVENMSGDSTIADTTGSMFPAGVTSLSVRP